MGTLIACVCAILYAEVVYSLCVCEVVSIDMQACVHRPEVEWMWFAHVHY